MLFAIKYEVQDAAGRIFGGGFQTVEAPDAETAVAKLTKATMGEMSFFENGGTVRILTVSLLDADKRVVEEFDPESL
jgi:hypothetical protein